ncbi:DUF397 domain-containing protein [Streptomyces sp. NPDC056194]|uniref:DUF397 domain-containing protein n=1 Tax=unclassified Streptomyces TaxID=2593676 RepID=UPI0035DFC202
MTGRPRNLATTSAAAQVAAELQEPSAVLLRLGAGRRLPRGGPRSPRRRPVRDSKVADGDVIVIGAGAWAAFVDGIRLPSRGGRACGRCPPPPPPR